MVLQQFLRLELDLDVTPSFGQTIEHKEKKKPSSVSLGIFCKFFESFLKWSLCRSQTRSLGVSEERRNGREVLSVDPIPSENQTFSHIQQD